MKNILVKIQGLILLMLLSSSISAETLPKYYPDTFSMSGTINRIDIKRGDIIVSDLFLKLSMNVKVHSLNTEFSSVQTLRNGMNIGFEMNSINGRSHVAEIWILPDNYTPNEVANESME